VTTVLCGIHLGMNGENPYEGQTDDVEDEVALEREDGVELELEDDFEPEKVPEEPIEIDTVGTDDNVGDISVEINVDELVAKIESDEGGVSQEKLDTRRKLEELEEQRKADEGPGGTYNINLDDEP